MLTRGQLRFVPNVACPRSMRRPKSQLNELCHYDMAEICRNDKIMMSRVKLNWLFLAAPNGLIYIQGTNHWTGHTPIYEVFSGGVVATMNLIRLPTIILV